MQVLSNALPGFRDLRAPVIAGYVWLLLGWLIVRPDLSQDPSGAVESSLFALAAEVGTVGTAVAVSVGAYLLGAISQELSQMLLERPSRREGVVERSRLGKQMKDLYAHGTRSIESQQDKEREDIDADLAELDTQYKATATAVAGELDLPATLLVGDNQSLFAEVDRLRAEGELRLSVVLPLATLIAYLFGTTNRLWVVAGIGVGLLFLQGSRRKAESQEMVAEAMAQGLIQSGALERFKARVEAIPSGPRRSRAA
jgi:hypothetical protein